MSVRILQGDCRERLAELEPESVDSCVTDPPYHLTSIVKRFGAANAAPVKAGKTGAYARASRGFMGQTWDGGDVAFDPETWAAVFRVLKPGAHLVAFSGTRTYHRMVCAIEDAGFEIRDQLAWVYGSGFPKSHNQPGGWGTALKPAWEPICLARKPLQGTVAATMAKHGTGGLNIDGCRVETDWETDATRRGWQGRNLSHDGGTVQFVDKGKHLSQPNDLGRWPANIIHDGSEEVLAGFPETVSVKRGVHNSKERNDGEVYGKIARDTYEDNTYADSGSAARFFYTAKADSAERHAGLDSHEMVSIVAKWESVVLNLTLRVDTDQSPPKVIAVSGTPNSNVSEWSTWLFGSENEGRSLSGCKSTTRTAINSTTTFRTLSFLARSITNVSIAAANSETGKCTSPAADAANTSRSVTIISGETAYLPGVAPAPSGTQFTISVSEGRSTHPTVKPIDLMRYLCRLITPKGGLVLDPFAGSGSTLIAADLEQFNAIGCEMKPEYAAIAERRVRAAAGLFAEVQAA